MDDLVYYQRGVHEREVMKWHARHQRPWNPDSISLEGVIVPGVAAGWLYVTNGPVAFIENVVTNPEASSEDRHAALDAIHDWAFKAAKSRGYRRLVALVTHDGLVPRAEAYGYENAGKTTVLVKELN
jgi:hypothetical protein